MTEPTQTMVWFDERRIERAKANLRLAILPDAKDAEPVLRLRRAWLVPA